MNTDKLSQILSNNISNVSEKERMVSLILFGIEYAEYLGEGEIYKVIKQASRKNTVINFSYDMPIKYGVDLSKYVILKII